MRLYFLRHGLAGKKSAWHGDDALRPLTQEGIDALAAEAETIYGLKLGLDQILTSPLVRAFQTAEIVARRLGMQARLVEDERLSPGCGLEQLGAILADYPDRQALMLVGHEPDFSGMLSDLVGGAKLEVKKGGLARVDLAQTGPPQGALIWLVPPELLIRSELAQGD